ncbi:MAG TPA: trifunctional transcriptional activator/DNA repair protein Ada/methylated-DNA--[protein]-cysteine S-methyltransferase [Gemmatimonadaceae bacterium]|nr:trifunctional transcriptional activator/DNA repair protein Ada/methylated-DNA--[protein]-cysteine S-methyltransferase [Gemmatimonadaceae bacterium]
MSTATTPRLVPPPPALPSPREMEAAYQGRDVSYDGVFFLGVRTTGVFCRPSCPARKPLARNVEYFATVREAVFAGYRPCKRCHPLEATGRAPDWVAALLARVERAPAERVTDGELRRLGVEPARVRRYFQTHYGMTFHAYARGRRLGRAFERLREGAELDHVALDSGFESHSGFRDAFARTFGDAPGRSRGAPESSHARVVLAWVESPLGPLVAGATDAGVCLLEFTDRRMLEAQLDSVRRHFGVAAVPGAHPHLDRLREELAAYFAGTLTRFTVPLVYPGSPFQTRVWDALLAIPYGDTCSYEALAASIGSPGAQRAVGHANGLNRIAIVIPCHRVVNKDGKLGGYGGGLWRKQRLLELERGELSLSGEAGAG